MDAAEWFLKCINAKPIPSVDAAAKQRATQVLKRAEELKEPLKHFKDELKGTADDLKSGARKIRDFDPLNPDSAEKPDPDRD